MNIDKIPFHIISSYFAVSAVFVPRNHSDVIMFGVYGNMLTGDFDTIIVETGFDNFNQLLTIATEDGTESADSIISAISEAITRGTENMDITEINNCGGLVFPDHLFSFSLLLEEDKDVITLAPDDIFYQLNGFIPREDWLEEFCDPPPDDDQHKVLYYHKLLAIRYAFYLVHLKNMRHSKAARLSNLIDPVVFQLAEVQYKLLY